MTEKRPGEALEQPETDRALLQRRLLVIPFSFAVFSLSALFYYHCYRDTIAVESPLQVFYAAIYRTFGFAPSLMFFLLLLVWTSIWFFSGRIERPWVRVLRLAATMVMLGIFLNVGESTEVAPHQGELGAFFASRMVAAFGYYPSIVLTFIAALGALFLATDFLFSETFERLGAPSGPAAQAATSKRSGSARPSDDGVEVEVTDHLKGLAAATGAVTPARASAAGSVERATPTVNPTAAEAVVDPAPRRATDDLDTDSAAGDRPADTDTDTVTDFEAAAPATPAGGGPVPVDDGLVETYEFREHDDAPEVEPAVEDVPAEVIEPRRRRRSYFERRFEEVRQSEDGEADGATGPSDDEPWVPSAGDSQEIDNPEIVGDGRAAERRRAEVESAEESVVEDEAADGDLADVVAAIEAADEAATAHDEPVFDIPRPERAGDPAPSEAVGESDAAGEIASANPRAGEADFRDGEEDGGSRQQQLFGAGIDEELVDEAHQVVLETRRATATFLRRRLRIGYDEACDVLAELSARGVVELGEDASQGRVIDPAS